MNVRVLHTKLTVSRTFSIFSIIDAHVRWRQAQIYISGSIKESATFIPSRRSLFGERLTSLSSMSNRAIEVFVSDQRDHDGNNSDVLKSPREAQVKGRYRFKKNAREPNVMRLIQYRSTSAKKVRE